MRCCRVGALDFCIPAGRDMEMGAMLSLGKTFRMGKLMGRSGKTLRAVGTSNVKHHLSLSESDKIRLLLYIASEGDSGKSLV